LAARHSPAGRTEVVEGVEEGTVGTARPVASGATAAPPDATIELGKQPGTGLGDPS
jgi:hypothetical protein